MNRFSLLIEINPFDGVFTFKIVNLVPVTVNVREFLFVFAARSLTLQRSSTTRRPVSRAALSRISPASSNHLCPTWPTWLHLPTSPPTLQTPTLPPIWRLAPEETHPEWWRTPRGVKRTSHLSVPDKSCCSQPVTTVSHWDQIRFHRQYSARMTETTETLSNTSNLFSFRTIKIIENDFF